MERLTTRLVQGPDDIRVFFDALAKGYRESHGDAARLLDYRLAVIRSLLQGVERSCLVEIGCGNGLHLFPLAAEFEASIGVDLSPAMIAAAEAARDASAYGARVRLHACAAERLDCVEDAVADAVLCVGAFEHMQNQRGVLREVNRVLKRGGRFVCLTVNGAHVWYTQLAPRLGLDTRHLSTDHFVTRREWHALLKDAALPPSAVGCWRFVPAGDMPGWSATIMRALDPVGAALGLSMLRGGFYVKAVKP